MLLTATVQAPPVTLVIESAMQKKAPSTKSTVPHHPSTAVMVIAAITELKEKKGSSLSAVKKYMSTNFKVDSAKYAPFIRKFLKAAVLKGSLVQTNGNGAMGHFKLPIEVKKKAVVSKKPSATTAKVTTATKKSAEDPKKRKLAVKAPSAKKPKIATAKPRKSLVKAKKVVAAPKPPKVKKTTAVKQTKISKNK